jgi:rubredoxin
MTSTDGALVVGARCTEESCDWGPMGADDPNTWRLVEDFRREHEDETDHTTTVEVVRQRTIVDGGGLDSVTLDIAEEGAVAIEWVCPECEQTAADLDAGRRCPDCDEPFREALP